jgi:acyl-CoA reductase-like NAD-dependent aldehyde dehydrogenase
MTLPTYDISKKCSGALVWIEIVQDLDSRFQEVSEAVAQAKTAEERDSLLALAWEIVRQAEEQLAQLKSKIQQIKEAQANSHNRNIKLPRSVFGQEVFVSIRGGTKN